MDDRESDWRGGAAWVAIPAKNEADELPLCLAALAAQTGARLAGAVLCLNNCTDGSAEAVRRLAPALPYALEVIEEALPPDRAFAGEARRIAMDHAAALAGNDGVILTTDADGRVNADWLAVNLSAIAAGADAVAGQADIDPEGASRIPSHLHAIDARECAYASLLDEIRSMVDPDPADPWPRHDEHSGASIAVTVAAYRLAGGMPPVRLAEDRAFFDALRLVDARIRHDRNAKVVVSARIFGRAQGGMADTIRRRIETIDPFLDDRLEPAADALRRARLRAALGRVWRGEGATGRLASRLGGELPLRRLLSEPYFGRVWEQAEQRSPVLQQRRPVSLADLARETARATRIRDRLRGAAALNLEEDRADTVLLEAAE